MSINNTLQNTYNGLFKSNKSMPVNNTVPGLLNKFTPAQSALNSKTQSTQPNWQGTLKNVISGPDFLPNTSQAPVNPTRPNQIMTSLPTKGLVNTQKINTTDTIQKAPVGTYTAQPVDTTSTQPVQTTTSPTTSTQTTQPSQTFPGTVSGLVKIGTQGSEGYNKAVENLANFNKSLAEKYGAIENTPIPLNFQQGREQVLARQAASQQAALQGAVTQQQTQQGQQISALGTAANLSQPQLAGFNQQVFNPLTGKMEQGGSLDEAVKNVVSKLTAGQMTYNDAVNALSGYGQGGVNALQQALPEGFNIAQSNTLAAQQGQIKPAYEYAQTAIANLQKAVGNLGTGQNTNIPIINQIAQGVSTTFGVGSQAVQAYKGAIAEARSAIQKVLASVQGGTPTDYVGQSNALLPDNATPNQIAAAAETLKTLGQAKVNIYGNPGQSGTTTGTVKTNYGDIDPNL